LFRITEFVEAEECCQSQEYCRAVIAPLADEERREVETLLDQIFTDRDVIDPSDVTLCSSYVQSIEEPLLIALRRRTK
jgi:hypothetical protein